MSIQTVNLGNYANDSTGDDLRTAFEKYNVTVSDLDETRVIDGVNLGNGAPVFAEKVDKNLAFRSIVEGGTPGNVFITYSENEIVIAVRDAIGHIEEDTNPRLGGNLNLNTHTIQGIGEINVTGDITAERYYGVFKGDLIVDNSTLTVAAINTISGDYSTIFLNGLQVSGNNVNVSGTSVLSTFIGDGMAIASGDDLDITSETGKINIYQPTHQAAAGGIQLNVDGTVGAIGFLGPLTGDVTGVITGLYGSNIQGDVEGIITGLPGSEINGILNGDVFGTLTGNVYGNLVGYTTGTHTGSVIGTVSDLSNHVLNDLSDVSLIVPSYGQVLSWNGSQWAPQDQADAVTAYDFGEIGVSVTSPFQLLFQSSTISFGSFLDPSEVIWDLGGIVEANTPTYVLARSDASIVEGATATISLTTTNIGDGENIPYLVTGSGITGGDFTTFTLAGNFTINSNFDSVTVDTAADGYAEGTETLTLTLLGITPTKSISISIIDNTPMEGGGPSTPTFTDTTDGGSPSVTPANTYDGGSP
jgi:hypothetical protein